MSRRPATRRRCARVFPVLASIVAHYTRGTRYGIAVDPADGLLRAGEAGVQLTWMDAKVGDWVVTPAHRQAGRDQRAVVQCAVSRWRRWPSGSG